MKQLMSENATDRWFGILPCLHAHCACLESDTREARMRIHLWESREGLDGQNLVTRRIFFYELAANKCNDPSFKPESKAHPDLQEDFLLPLKFHDHDDVKTPLYALDKIKDFMGTTQSQVSIQFVNN